jgi:hypothetical protein
MLFVAPLTQACARPKLASTWAVKLRAFSPLGMNRLTSATTSDAGRDRNQSSPTKIPCLQRPVSCTRLLIDILLNRGLLVGFRRNEL